jgi:hypothetical protein
VCGNQYAIAVRAGNDVGAKLVNVGDTSTQKRLHKSASVTIDQEHGTITAVPGHGAGKEVVGFGGHPNTVRHGVCRMQ